MDFEPISSIDKNGKERVWSLHIEQNDGEISIVRKAGQVGGKISRVSKKVPRGKAGRTPMEQAILEAKSMYNKKLIDDSTPKPTLAEEYRKHGHKLPRKVLVQPKLDGVRMLVRMNTDKSLSMFSRSGKDVTNMGHLEKDLKSFMKPGDIMDGEVYDPDLPFEEISGKFRKNSSNFLKFFIFDKVGNGPYMTRNNYKVKTTLQYVFFVETRVTIKTEIEKCHDQYVSQGYEGVMVRNPDCEYICGRTKNLQKFKKFFDKEFEIVGAEEGTGTDEGTVIFTCITENGYKFNARPKGSLELRRNYLENFKKILGKFLTVKFQEYSENGIPRFPVGISVRDYE